MRNRIYCDIIMILGNNIFYFQDNVCFHGNSNRRNSEKHPQTGDLRIFYSCSTLLVPSASIYIVTVYFKYLIIIKAYSRSTQGGRSAVPFFSPCIHFSSHFFASRKKTKFSLLVHSLVQLDLTPLLDLEKIVSFFSVK